MSIKNYYKIFFILLILLSSCSKDRKETMDFEKINITNKYELKETESIRLIEDEYPIGVILCVQVDESGNIYLADHARKQVLVYNRNGKLKRTIGNAGDGPGEFRYCINIRLFENERIGVSDWMLNRISFFDTSGVYLNEIKMADDTRFRNMPGYFDYSIDGKTVYVGILENMDTSPGWYNKTKIVCAYNEEMEPVELFGTYDPYMTLYGEDMNPWTIVRTNKNGDIYTIQPSIPRVTKYSKDYIKIDDYSFYSDEFLMPYGKSKEIDQNDPYITRIYDFYVGQKTNNIYISHYYFEPDDTKGVPFLTVIDQNGEALAIDIPIPNQTGFFVDANENIYFLKNVEPDNMILSKSVLVPIRGDIS